MGSALPKVLPVLPLKDSVPFPDTLTPLAVGQERSVQLVNDVLGGDRMLVMVASKNPELDTPQMKRCGSFGTLAEPWAAGRASISATDRSAALMERVFIFPLSCEANRR